MPSFTLPIHCLATSFNHSYCNASETPSYIEERREKDQVKNQTINSGLQVVRHTLNLASSVWLDEHGLTWLTAAPKIKLLSEHDKREPYPISWEEQERLLCELPGHLRDLVLFAVNTGCREAEICSLRWEWDIKAPISGSSVFVIPSSQVKNRE